MFDTLVLAASPPRSRLAGPAAALAHGLVITGFLAAAYWNAGEISLPDPPAPDSFVCVLLPPSGGGSSQDSRPTAPVPRQVRSASFPDRLSSEAPLPAKDEETTLSGKGNMTSGDDKGAGTGDKQVGPGSCTDCPIGPDGPFVGDDPVFEPGGRVLAPVLIHSVEPPYPDSLRRARVEGTVVIRAIIAKDGGIEEASAVTATNLLFEAEALKAVRQWRYRPGTLNGEPVRVLLAVVVTFRLR